MNIIEQYERKFQNLKNLESKLIDNGVCDESEVKRLSNLLEDKINNFQAKMMVYGVYNSGKSTTINALVGKEVAKTGDTPETKEIRAYKYNEYEIFDTPGINAPADDEKITEDYYKQCELILFVMSEESIENDFIYKKIKRIIDDDKKAIVIFNQKHNNEDNEKYSEVLVERIYQNLSKLGFSKEDAKYKISVYPVNSLSAFNAKINDKELLYKNSGFEELENKIKYIFLSSTEADVINVCNKNISDFVSDVSNKIDQKIDNESIKLIENFISNTQREKTAALLDMRSILNENLGVLKNNLISKPESELGNINDILKQEIEIIKEKIISALMQKVSNLKQNIENIEYSFDKLNNISINDNSNSESIFTKSNISNWLSMAEKILILLPQTRIIGVILPVIRFISNILSDDASEKNAIERSKNLEIANKIEDAIIKIKKGFIDSISEQVNNIYDPIINANINSKDEKEKSKNNLEVIKAEVVEFGQNLPYV